jgi:predicted transcriptional regulator of viral defense system
MKQQYIEEMLEKQGVTVFTSQELRRAAGLSAASAKHLLIRYVKKGIVLKLKENRGLYCFKRKPPHPWLVANRLFRPSYISLETALTHYGAIPESVYGVTSVTPLATKTFHALNTAFSFQKIKKAAYAGYRPIDIEGTTVLVAEPEKALADYLYFVHLGKKTLNDRIRWTAFKKTAILRYLKLFERPKLSRWADNVISSND